MQLAQRIAFQCDRRVVERYAVGEVGFVEKSFGFGTKVIDDLGPGFEYRVVSRFSSKQTKQFGEYKNGDHQ